MEHLRYAITRTVDVILFITGNELSIILLSWLWKAITFIITAVVIGSSSVQVHCNSG